MSRFRIVNLIDKLFITIASFLIIYAWLNFYIRDLTFTFILSVIFSLAFTYVLFFILEKKNTKKQTSAKLNEEIDKNFLAFRLTPTKEKLNLLNEILSIDYETKQNSKTIVYNKGNLICCVVIASHIQCITQEDLINILEQNRIKADCLEIICNEVDSNINSNLVKNLKINFINKTTLYNEFFSKYNTYPNTSILNEKELKLNFKMVVKNLFKEQKSKRYFFLGLVLIFSSLILPYKTYNLIFGSGFLICSILCKVLPKFKH